MRLPKTREYAKSYIVREEVWDLKFTNEILDRSRKGRDPLVLGLCDPSEKLIQIRTDQTQYETFKTFVHEFIHAAEEEYNFDLTEEVVGKLEAAIAHFLISNF